MDNDEILTEILVRLPPRPSSFLCASLVCKRWRRFIADPYFLRRLRAHHREMRPIGLFAQEGGVIRFTPLLEPPDCIPRERLSMSTNYDEGWRLVECRNGLALLLSRKLMEVAVWDPVTGEKRCLAVPPEFKGQYSRKIIWSAALLCDDSKQALSVIVLGHGDLRKDDQPQVFASVFESGAGIWGDLIFGSMKAPLWLAKPSTLVGNSLCWWLCGNRHKGILEFDRQRKNLAVIDTPVDAHVILYSTFQIIRMEDNGLGLAILSDVRMQLWERKTDSGGFSIWMLHKAIELDKLLSLPVESTLLMIQGYYEDGEMKLRRGIVPDEWKEGTRNTNESGGLKIDRKKTSAIASTMTN
nr:unnamed protein product [Digitaria exilis]